MKEIIGGYRIAGKLPKGDFKRLTGRVIDVDKVLTGMSVIRTTPEQLSRITIIFNSISCLHECRYLGSVRNSELVPLSLLNFTEWEEIY